MKQYGFYLDVTRCAGCHACQIACKDKNRLNVGTFFRRVRSFETGEFPHPGVWHLSESCHHCDHPACAAACPVGRIVKDGETGLVVFDAEVKCLGERCQRCVRACPYGHPVYIPASGEVGKCGGCLDSLREGRSPACVESCMMRALKFGPVDELREKYGADAVTALPCFPDGGTGSNFLIRPSSAARESVFEEKHY